MAVAGKIQDPGITNHARRQVSIKNKNNSINNNDKKAEQVEGEGEEEKKKEEMIKQE